MGYIRVKYQKLLSELDRTSWLPDGFKKFVDDKTTSHNLIFKGAKSVCKCGNCGHEFKSKTKVNNYEKCPNCNNTYLVKRNCLNYYEFKDYFSLIDKVDGQLVIRYFEAKSLINKYKDMDNFRKSVVEFAREFVDYEKKNYYDGGLFVNERVSRNTGPSVVYHFEVKNKWRSYTKYYSLVGNTIVFPNNLQPVLRNTDYQYSMLWDLVKRYDYIDIKRLFKIAKSTNKMELLIKAKLYNLAFEADRFRNSGNFEKIFEVPKSFYNFMKKYNITYPQLEILRILKEEDIKAIRYLEKYSINDLQRIAKYISLYRFIKYSKQRRKKVETYIYKDYLKFASSLGFDLKNNKYAFPKNLREEHDKLEEQYEIACKEIVSKKIEERGKVLSINSFKNRNYFVTPAPTYKSLLDESKQQNHCVRTYAESYAEGDCDIYFMRDNNTPDKSLVTIEVKNNTIVQSRTKNNYSPSKKELKFLERWENKVLRKVA